MEALPLLQIAKKAIKWVNESPKWSYKIVRCSDTYIAKWLVRKCPPKEVVSNFIEKGNLKCFPTMKGTLDVKITHQ